MKRISIVFLFAVSGLSWGCSLEVIPDNSTGPAPGAKTFELRLGGAGLQRGYGVTATSDGGYVLVGETRAAGSTASDVWLLKLDANGVEVWDRPRTFGAAPDEVGYSVRESPDRDLVVAATATAAGKTNFFFVRALADGSQRNALTLNYGSTSQGRDAFPLADGTSILVGTTNLCALPGVCDHLWFVKMDGQGQFVGQNDGYGSGVNTLGLGGALANDGSFLAVGRQFDNNQQKFDVFLALQPTTAFATFPTIQQLIEPGDQSARAAVALVDNTFAIIGETENNASGPSDLLYLRVNKSLNLVGNPIRIGGAGTERGNGIALTADGGLVLIGETTSTGAGGSDVYLVKVDLTGAVQWERTFGGAFRDVGEDVIATSDGGFLLVGHTQRSADPDDVDVFVIKTDAQGRVR